MKQYKNNTWIDVSCYIFETSSEIVSPPTEIITNGQPLSNWEIKGNLLQESTPAPQSPIYPQETGDLVTTGEHAGQYKIPISSANTTTPVYLGEVETTRKIKKLVLTGEESTWRITGTGRLAVEIPVDGIIGKYCVCSHYKGTNVTSLSNLNDKECEVGTLNSSNKQEFVVYDTDYSTAADFKAYLANQYANGTPVCVWYVLAEPTTGIVNEPIRKIGDYADTISNVAEIPTTAGSQTFDVDTTLKPSSVEITYKGWHKHTPKEYDNGSWS